MLDCGRPLSRACQDQAVLIIDQRIIGIFFIRLSGLVQNHILIPVFRQESNVHADKRHGADVRASVDHLFDLAPGHRAVLHLKPGEIVVRSFFAVAINVEARDRMTEDLLAFLQLLLDFVD